MSLVGWWELLSASVIRLVVEVSLPADTLELNDSGMTTNVEDVRCPWDVYCPNLTKVLRERRKQAEGARSLACCQNTNEGRCG